MHHARACCVCHACLWQSGGAFLTLCLWRWPPEHVWMTLHPCMASCAEGRIEPSDGTLMCSYHGWRFDGEGQCTDVPQSLDAKANAAACTTLRSCAVSRPTQVRSST